jgi:hypothetical protein
VKGHSGLSFSFGPLILAGEHLPCCHLRRGRHSLRVESNGLGDTRSDACDGGVVGAIGCVGICARERELVCGCVGGRVGECMGGWEGECVGGWEGEWVGGWESVCVRE